MTSYLFKFSRQTGHWEKGPTLILLEINEFIFKHNYVPFPVSHAQNTCLITQNPNYVIINHFVTLFK